MSVEAPQRQVTPDHLATEVTKMQTMRTAIVFQELTGEKLPQEVGKEATIVTGEQLAAQMQTVKALEQELVAKGSAEVVSKIEITHGLQPAPKTSLESHIAANGDY